MKRGTAAAASTICSVERKRTLYKYISMAQVKKRIRKNRMKKKKEILLLRPRWHREPTIKKATIHHLIPLFSSLLYSPVWLFYVMY
jgi:hypothetical protein